MKPRRFPGLLPALMSVPGAGCGQRPASTAPAVAVASEMAATMVSLPLKRGYYVATDTACAEAANARPPCCWAEMVWAVRVITAALSGSGKPGRSSIA